MDKVRFKGSWVYQASFQLQVETQASLSSSKKNRAQEGTKVSLGSVVVLVAQCVLLQLLAAMRVWFFL